MAYLGRIQTYQRIRTAILRDAWLIDHDHKEEMKGKATSRRRHPTPRFSLEHDGRRRQQSRAVGLINPTTRTTSAAVATTMPRWERHQRRTSGVDDSNATGTAKPRLAAPDVVG
jgi:hypothetical protein